MLPWLYEFEFTDGIANALRLVFAGEDRREGLEAHRVCHSGSGVVDCNRHMVVVGEGPNSNSVSRTRSGATDTRNWMVQCKVPGGSCRTAGEVVGIRRGLAEVDLPAGDRSCRTVAAD